MKTQERASLIDTTPSLESTGRVAAGSTLIFIYNADTGLFNVVTDYAHKILSPKTYPCNLCAVTYGTMGMNTQWKDFVASLSLPVEFLHRDELLKHHMPQDVRLPAAFLKTGTSVTPFITHDEINECTSVDDLMKLVKRKLETRKA